MYNWREELELELEIEFNSKFDYVKEAYAEMDDIVSSNEQQIFEEYDRLYEENDRAR